MSLIRPAFSTPPMLPNEGIDKIKVFLNPLWVNVKEAKRHPDPYNHLTLHQSGMFAALAIHAEFCNPFHDYCFTIACAVYELIKKHIIMFPDNPFTLLFVYHNLHWFICGVQEIEFYFDIRPMSITIGEDVVEQGRLQEYKGTFYTKDYRNPKNNNKSKNKRKSVGIIYDKAKKNFHDNHINHKTIEQYPYKTRLEFRLIKRNCQYLNLFNLQGTYFDIINRFTPYLAIQYGKWFRDSVNITWRDNQQLKCIVEQSAACRKRYRGDELKKSSVIRIEENRYDTEGRMQMQQMIKGRFYRERQKAQTTGDTSLHRES